MEFLIVTGLSGAGKSRAMVVLEDLGFYCVDNIPADMVPVLADLCQAGGERYAKTAVVVDIRTLRTGPEGLLEAFDRLDENRMEYSVMFLEARDETILRRYKETRRKHPLHRGDMTILEAVQKEREILTPIRERASYILDSTETSVAELRQYIVSYFDREKSARMQVRILSFGYKYGIPPESDFVFDMRFLPNPFYISDLRHKGGEDPAVADYLNAFGETIEFRRKLEELTDFLLPYFDKEGRSSLVISMGCTGGQHRSVAMAEALGALLRAQGRAVTILHRDRMRNMAEIRGRDQ
ncbi:MAG: RNase adapter RapZ [Clostridia bacterium]|nr:RNase adapter RapZ [Clostridia bacterium]